MTFDFHPEAEAEFIEAIAFYDEVEPSLGEEFSLEVLAALTIPFVSNAWRTEETSDVAWSTAFRTHPLKRRAGRFLWLP